MPDLDFSNTESGQEVSSTPYVGSLSFVGGDEDIASNQLPTDTQQDTSPKKFLVSLRENPELAGLPESIRGRSDVNTRAESPDEVSLFNDADEAFIRLAYLPPEHPLAPKTPEERKELMDLFNNAASVEQQHRAAKAFKTMGAIGLETGLGIAFPELAGIRRLGIMGRLAGEPLMSATGSLLGRELSQYLDFTPEKTFEEDLDLFLADAALEGSANVLLEGISAGTKFISDKLNASERVARLFGATNDKLKEFGRTPVDHNIKFLQNTSTEFSDRVLSQDNLHAAYKEAVDMLDTTGKKLEIFYRGSNGRIPVFTSEIRKNRRIDDLFGLALNPKTPTSMRKAVAEALKEIPEVFTKPGRDVAINEVWQLRKHLDNMLTHGTKTAFDKQLKESPLKDQFLVQIRDGLKDVLNRAAKRGASPEDYTEFVGNNLLYSNLRPVVTVLDAGQAAEKGKFLIDRNMQRIFRDAAVLGTGATVGGLVDGSEGAQTGTLLGAGAILGSTNYARSLVHNIEPTLDLVPGPGARSALAIQQLLRGQDDPKISRSLDENSLPTIEQLAVENGLSPEAAGVLNLPLEDIENIAGQLAMKSAQGQIDAEFEEYDHPYTDGLHSIINDRITDEDERATYVERVQQAERDREIDSIQGMKIRKAAITDGTVIRPAKIKPSKRITPRKKKITNSSDFDRLSNYTSSANITNDPRAAK